jgi:hypothetical protein
VDLLIITLPQVEAIGIKDHAVMDIHLGGGGGVKVAEDMFSKYRNYTMGAVNAETKFAISPPPRLLCCTGGLACLWLRVHQYGCLTRPGLAVAAALGSTP